jgi:hypothetical protein
VGTFGDPGHSCRVLETADPREGPAVGTRRRGSGT